MIANKEWYGHGHDGNRGSYYSLSSHENVTTTYYTCTYLKYSDNELGSLFYGEGLPEPIARYEDKATKESE